MSMGAAQPPTRTIQVKKQVELHKGRMYILQNDVDECRNKTNITKHRNNNEK